MNADLTFLEIFIRNQTKHLDPQRCSTLQSTAGGECCTSLPPLLFAFVLKISRGNQYLKKLDLPNLFVADAPVKKKI